MDPVLAALSAEPMTFHNEAGLQAEIARLLNAAGICYAREVRLSRADRIDFLGWHRAVYDLWLDSLKAFRPVLYTGSESPKQKQAALDAFKTPTDEGACKRSPGVQCSASSTGPPQVHEQAIGRLRRDGMDATEPPLAYYLLADDGSDPAIAEVLQVKRQQSESLVSPDGRLFDNAVADTSRSRMLAEAVLAGVKQ